MKRLLVFFLVLLLSLPAFAIEIDNLKFGGQVRFREYQLKNMWNFDDENRLDVWRMFRLKTSLFTTADLGDGISGKIQFTNQTYGEGISDAEDNKSNKVFADNAYIDVKKFAGLPLDLRIGRQNLMYGSGFVLFDGQSQYASTSMYFDALKASLTFTEQGTLDIIYAKDQENTRDERTYDDVTLYGLYLTLKKTLPMQTEVYLLNRLDEAKDKELFMVGARLSDKLEMGLDYSVEGAFQTGETDSSAGSNVDHEAFGAKLDVGYSFKVNMKPRVFAQFAFLSGDDPDTEEYEGWDVYYGGWPQFGDLLAWAYVTHSKIPSEVTNSTMQSTEAEAPFTNFSIGTLGFSLAPVEKVSCKFSVSMIKYNEDFVNSMGNAITDDDFGNYFQLNLGYQYSKNLSFGLYAAMIDPGDAFDHTEQDPASEIFYQADLKF